MKDYFSPGDVITPAPGCDWFKPPHPFLIIVSARRGVGGWWQVTTNPPLARRMALDPHGLILPSEWTVIGHQDE